MLTEGQYKEVIKSSALYNRFLKVPAIRNWNKEMIGLFTQLTRETSQAHYGSITHRSPYMDHSDYHRDSRRWPAVTGEDRYFS